MHSDHSDLYRPSGKRRWGARRAVRRRQSGAEYHNFWDSDLVSSVAFHPRTCPPSTNHSVLDGGWMDGDIPLEDEGRLAYRLYLAPLPRTDETQLRSGCILIYFHANAELLTDMEEEFAAFHACGVGAILCPEYRGYAWSSGSPKLSRLCPDAEVVLRAVPEILVHSGAEGLAGAPVIVHGRSLGAACAVHLASLSNTNELCGVIVESGCLAIAELPMVANMGCLMPQLREILRSEPDPLQTMKKACELSLPVLFIHGSRDDIVPVDQAVTAHEQCKSIAKRLVLLSRARHNDLRTTADTEYFAEIRLFCSVVLGLAPREALNEPRGLPSESGVLSVAYRTLRCIPGMQRCLRL